MVVFHKNRITAMVSRSTCLMFKYWSFTIRIISDRYTLVSLHQIIQANKTLKENIQHFLKTMSMIYKDNFREIDQKFVYVSLLEAATSSLLNSPYDFNPSDIQFNQ